jgi:hypothetical protein
MHAADRAEGQGKGAVQRVCKNGPLPLSAQLQWAMSSRRNSLMSGYRNDTIPSERDFQHADMKGRTDGRMLVHHTAVICIECYHISY